MVGTSDLMGTSSVGGAGTGIDCLAVEEVRDVSEESKEVSRRDPAPKEMTEWPPMDCPPTAGAPCKGARYPPCCEALQEPP